MAPRILSKTRDAIAAPARERPPLLGGLDFDNRKTAEALGVSKKTLERLDAARRGPRYFMVRGRKRRTGDDIRRWVEGNKEKFEDETAA